VRVFDPDWMLRFLKNPALSDRDTTETAVRTYLQVRMPTFSFSDNELGKLVAVLPGAFSRQPLPYVPEPSSGLEHKRNEMARSLFSSPAAPCLNVMPRAIRHTIALPLHRILEAKGRLKADWSERWIIDPQEN